MSTTQLNGDYVINHYKDHMDVSENSGIPKSSILIGFSIINHPFLGALPYFWKHPYKDPYKTTRIQNGIQHSGNQLRRVC